MKPESSPKLRKSFSKKHLLGTVRQCFEEIEDLILGRGYTLVDFLMSGLAVFSPALMIISKRPPVYSPFRYIDGKFIVIQYGIEC